MKTNVFRMGVGQPLLNGGQAADTPANYCKNMMQVGMARTARDEKPFTAFASPVPATGSNLFSFLAARLSASWGNLGCGALLNAPDPVNVTVDANGVATAATFSPLAIGTLPGGVAATATPSATPTATPTCAAAPTPAAMATATATPTPTGTATATRRTRLTAAPTPAARGVLRRVPAPGRGRHPGPDAVPDLAPGLAQPDRPAAPHVALRWEHGWPVSCGDTGHPCRR